MDRQSLTARGTTAPEARLTTSLACFWAAVSSYILFYCLLNAHNIRLGVAELIPLFVVWATLERKRWGRLALLGLCITTLVLFLSTLGFVALMGSQWHPTAQTLVNYVRTAADLFDVRVEIVLGYLVLATMTAWWLRRPAVAAEFNRNKNQRFSAGQRFIATMLVGCWSVFVAIIPLLPSTRNSALMGYHAVRSSLSPLKASTFTAIQDHNTSNRPIRSDNASSNW